MLRRVARNMGRVRVMGRDQVRQAARGSNFPNSTNSEPTLGFVGSEELAVLWVLADFYNDAEQRTFVGAPRLAEQTGFHRRSLERAIESLIERGIVVELGLRRMPSGHNVRTFGLNIPDDSVTQRCDMGHDASGDASGDASHGPQPATTRSEIEVEDERENPPTERSVEAWEVEACMRLDLERDPPNAIRSSRENLERHVAGDYASIIAKARSERVERGLLPIGPDDELRDAWVEYLLRCRKPEASRLSQRGHDLLFPKPPCPHRCDANGWIEPDPTDPEQRMIPCPTCRK